MHVPDPLLARAVRLESPVCLSACSCLPASVRAVPCTCVHTYVRTSDVSRVCVDFDDWHTEPLKDALVRLADLLHSHACASASTHKCGHKCNADVTM